jgi:membrane protein involved in colicin uptake
VQRLRELERQLRTTSPDERRRALGDLQLEARQIADAERQLASELGRGAGSGDVGNDQLRRAAGEQQRLADRARRVQDGLREQAAAMAGSPDKADGSQQAIGNAARDAERQRVAERMQQSAAQLRAAAADSDRQKAQDAAASAAAAQQAAASDLDDLAAKIARARTPQDADSQRLADQRAHAQQLRQDLDDLARQLEQAARGQAPDSSSSGGRQLAGDTGRAGRGQSGSGGGGGELARLRAQYEQKLRESRDLLEQMRRDDPSFSQGGPGLTFEGQGMTLSSPGTEAFKQDFAKWEQLHQQATQLLQRAETSLSDRLRTGKSDRLAAGADDRAPAAYQRPVNDYFKALARKPAP